MKHAIVEVYHRYLNDIKAIQNEIEELGLSYTKL